MKPYALDLRQKILDAYDHKRGSQRALAALFGVSRALLEQLLRRRRTSGATAPRPHADGRQPRCDAEALAVVRPLGREQPDAPREELGARLQPQRGLCLRGAPMGRVRQRLGRPRNNSPFMPPTATRRGLHRPALPPNTGRPRSSSGAYSLWMQPASISRGPVCRAGPPTGSGSMGPSP
jgi:transposase